MYKKKHYQSIIAVGVPAIIIDGNKRVLLVKRSGRSYGGTWGLPSETVQPGERLEEAVIRGMQEELGVKIKVIRFSGNYYDEHGRDPRYATAIDMPHVCKIIEGDPRPIEECSEVRWFSTKELSLMNLLYDQKKMLIEAGIIK
jgi:8-oxo-dGTP diphosphatase